VLNNKLRSVEEKEQIIEWLDSMPPRPLDKNKGFLTGDAEKWFTKCFGEKA
jgi:hypothetical protein